VYCEGVYGNGAAGVCRCLLDMPWIRWLPGLMGDNSVAWRAAWWC
jgi:hypothetical protein